MATLKSKISAVSLFILVFAFSWFCGYRGLDFGVHWDERLLIADIRIGFDSGTFLPHWYNYPSFTRKLVMCSTLPEFLQGNKKYPNKLIQIINSKSFKIRTRALFLTISLFTAIWWFILIRCWISSVWPALLTSSLILLNWEIGYHARWITVDPIMMQFCSLTILLLYFYYKNPGATWLLVASSISAGLSCGSKWPGGIMILPLLLLIVINSYFNSYRASKVFNTISTLFIAIVIFCFTVLVSTPGIMVQPFKFFDDIRTQMLIYGQWGHGGHNTNGFFEHALLVLRYYCLDGLSPFSGVACLLAVVSLFGLYQLVKRERIDWIVVFLSAPIIYLLYFAGQKVMIVRNYIVFIPYLAALSSIGVFKLHHKISSNRVTTIIIPTVCSIILLANAAWLWYASETIRNRHARKPTEELLRYIKENPSKKFSFSTLVREQVRKHDFSNVDAELFPQTRKQKTDNWFVFQKSEVIRWDLWPVNRFHYYLLNSGPFEVNWDYYPNWAGDDRIIMLPESTIRNTTLKYLVLQNIKHNQKKQ